MPQAAQTLSRTTTARRKSASKRGYGHHWQKLRLMILRRDPICKWPNCEQPSYHVDHITPRSSGGTNREDNLQGLCHRHHSIKTNMEISGQSFTPTTPIVFIYPPFCDPRTTISDVVGDSAITFHFDDVLNALSPVRSDTVINIVTHLRRALVEWLQFNNTRNTVVVTTTRWDFAREAKEQLNASLIVANPDEDDCRPHTQCDPTKEALMYRWYSERDLALCDKVV